MKAISTLGVRSLWKRRFIELSAEFVKFFCQDFTSLQKGVKVHVSRKRIMNFWRRVLSFKKMACVCGILLSGIIYILRNHLEGERRVKKGQFFAENKAKKGGVENALK